MNQVSFAEVNRLVAVVLSIGRRCRLSFSDVIDRIEDTLEGRIALNTGGRTDWRGTARTLLRARASRSEVLGAELFRDPAWDILLDLYASAGTSGEEASKVSALCHAAGVPATTALRYVHKMADAGILLCEDHPHDQRRTMVRLAPGMAERLESVLAILKSDG